MSPTLKALTLAQSPSSLSSSSSTSAAHLTDLEIARSTLEHAARRMATVEAELRGNPHSEPLRRAHERRAKELLSAACRFDAAEVAHGKKLQEERGMRREGGRK